MKNKTNRLFNIYKNDRGGNYSGNVWDTDALAPTLDTMTGGNRQPMIKKLAIWNKKTNFA